MNIDDLTSPAYIQGTQAAIASWKDGHLHMEDHPNPYLYGGDDWQRWNLGWNNEVCRGIQASGNDRVQLEPNRP